MKHKLKRCLVKNSHRLLQLTRFMLLTSIFLAGNIIYGQEQFISPIHLQSVNTGLSSPLRMAVDKQDVIYVTDVFQKSILKYTNSGEFIEEIFPGGLPICIAVSKNNDVIVSDNQSGDILQLNPDGSKRLIHSGCIYPSSAVFDSDNNLYVVDSKQKEVVVMDLAGQEIRSFGKDILIFPTGIAFDKKNSRILIAEHGGIPPKTGPDPKAQVHIFDLMGNILNSFGEFGYEEGQFSRIQGLTVDKWGRIYIVDPYQATVSIFDESGEFITRIGQFGQDAGQLNSPMDIVIDSRHQIWISSMNNGSLEIFSAGSLGIDNRHKISSGENALLPNYPNPFSEVTWIPFVLAGNENVTFNIYDIKGAKIRSIKMGYLEKGSYTGADRAFYWDGKNESGKKAKSGIYYYEMKLSSESKMGRVVYLR